MLRITSLLLLSPLIANAFTSYSPMQRNNGMQLHMSTEAEAGVALTITGNNIDLTPALQEHVEKRIGRPLNKLGGDGIVQDCEVHLSVYKNPKVKNAHRVDLTANLKGLTVNCKVESPDMYASIDSAATALQSKLGKYRQRRSDGHHAGSSMGDDLMAALEAMELDVGEEVGEDEFVDPEEPSVMKVDSFDLDNAIPLKEAIFALDYVDHDFFVFKNEETGKKSVVYKRNAGGVGLIEL
ncbi:unnamed protein product [Cylindrotheca closterium]|uniref:Sigma 54 modulation/S30EA ribosomal protein C-terminal domain-containing protein n=1 Tax=Cylindrotheca closterium TaxID=2856 RepID=A0AAD2G8Z9_9STRA|nr:unnamed protein product [Cylindrotheca closterium]